MNNEIVKEDKIKEPKKKKTVKEEKELVVNQHALVNVDLLNVRRAATTNSLIKDTVKKGVDLEILEDKGDWLMVKYEASDGKYFVTGYVMKEFTKAI